MWPSGRSCPSGLWAATTLKPNDPHLPAPGPEVSKVNEKFHPQQPCAWICFPHPCVMRPSAQLGRGRDYFSSRGAFNPSQAQLRDGLPEAAGSVVAISRLPL